MKYPSVSQFIFAPFIKGPTMKETTGSLKLQQASLSIWGYLLNRLFCTQKNQVPTVPFQPKRLGKGFNIRSPSRKHWSNIFAYSCPLPPTKKEHIFFHILPPQKKRRNKKDVLFFFLFARVPGAWPLSCDHFLRARCRCRSAGRSAGGRCEITGVDSDELAPCWNVVYIGGWRNAQLFWGEKASPEDPYWH